jgi:hypothetical protein
MTQLWSRPVKTSLTEGKIWTAVSPSWNDPLLSALHTAGASAQGAETVEEAIHNLEFQQPEFFIFSEGFGSSAGESNPLLEYIQQMPSNIRRMTFFVFISQKLKSGDTLSAFSHSVNLVMHPGQLQHLIDYITVSWSAWSDLYRVFFQTRRE